MLSKLLLSKLLTEKKTSYVTFIATVIIDLMSCSAVWKIKTSPVSLFTSSSAQKYEKKQISPCKRQDSECTLLKCYLGFGNCGQKDYFDRKREGEGVKEETETEWESHRTHTHTQRVCCLRWPRARDIICKISTEITVDRVPVTRFHPD